MATITFDSLKLSDKLKASGFTADLQIALEQALNPMKADLLVLKWAVGLNTALCLLILGKLFSH